MQSIKTYMLNNKSTFFGLVIVCLIGLGISCNKLENAGGDLLNGEWIHADGLDYSKLSASGYKWDSILTFEPNLSYVLNNFLVGQTDGPVFGKTEYGFNAQLRFVPDKINNFLKQPIDSIVLSLKYDSTEFYGPVDQPMDVEVFVLDQPLDISNVYYANHKASASKKLGGLYGFVPNGRDSIEVQLVNQKVKLAPQLRMRLDTALFMSMLRSYPDTVYNSADYFVKAFPGIAVRPANSKSVISVNPTNIDSKVTIYYKATVDSVIQSQFEFIISTSSVQIPYFEHQTAGSNSEPFEKNTEKGDSLIYINSGIGTDAEIIIPYDTFLQKRFINYAVLEFYSLELPGDNISEYKPIRYFNLDDLSSGKPETVIDLARANAAGGGVFSELFYHLYFGSVPEEVAGTNAKVHKYKLNITSHFKENYRLRKDLKLRLSPLFKTSSANRSVLGGTQHSLYPMKIKVTYSE